MENTFEPDIKILVGNPKLTVTKIFKITLLGDSSVGKTCLLEQFSDNKFSENTKNTVGVDFKILTLNCSGFIFKVQIWDTAGQERFKSITSNYLRGSDGYIIVYDVTNEESYKNLDYWLGELKKNRELSSVISVVGNKSDLDKKVGSSDCKKRFGADKFGYFETSAKTSENVKSMFGYMLREILKNVRSEKEENVQRLSSSSLSLTSQNKDKCAC